MFVSNTVKIMIPQILYIFSPPEPDLTFGIIITLINQSIKNSKKYLLVSKITCYIKVAYNFFSWKKISASNTHIEMNTGQKYTKKKSFKIQYINTLYNISKHSNEEVFI